MAFNVREIFKALADAEARFVVVGGLAVLLHGHLRVTRDLDLVVGLEPSNCRRALDALSSIGLRPRLPIALQDFADPVKRQDWHDNRNMLVLQLWDPVNEERAVDVFVTEPIAFDELEAEAVSKDLDGVPVLIASIRHLIRMKQAAGRRRDLDDIEALRQIAKETGVPVE
jgi:predicted nucleotidyltransferase